jgi:hypothetical protein
VAAVQLLLQLLLLPLPSCRCRPAAAVLPLPSCRQIPSTSSRFRLLSRFCRARALRSGISRFLSSLSISTSSSPPLCRGPRYQMSRVVQMTELQTTFIMPFFFRGLEL